MERPLEEMRTKSVISADLSHLFWGSGSGLVVWWPADVIRWTDVAVGWTSDTLRCTTGTVRWTADTVRWTADAISWTAHKDENLDRLVPTGEGFRV